MTLFPISPTLLPMADDETRNSAPETMSASYDLLSLPGIIISFLENDTVTASTGEDCHVSTQMLVSHPVRGGEAASISVGSTDSSVILAGLGDSVPQGGGCANQFRIPFKQPAMIDLAALMMLLGGFVALLVESTGHNPQQADLLQKIPAE